MKRDENMDRKIIELLKPLRVKLYIGNLIKYVVYSLILCGVISFGLIVTSRFIPISFLWNKILIFIVFFIALGIIYSLIRNPSYEETAILVDSLGLKERVVTSLELKGIDSGIARLQKEDTISRLKEDDFKGKIHIKPPRKLLFTLLILFIATILVGFIPTKAYEKSKELEKNVKKIEKEIENIKKVEDELFKDRNLTMKEKERIDTQLKELRKKLEKAKENKNIVKETSKVKKELEDIRKEIEDKLNKDIAEKLSKSELTKELAKAMEQGSSDEINEKIKDIADKLKEMNQEERKKATDELKDLAKELKESPQLSNALKDISDNISGSSIDGTSLDISLDNLSMAIGNINNNSEKIASIDEILSALEQLKVAASEASSSGDIEGSNDNNSGNTGTNGQGNSKGSNQGGNNGSNGNGGQGQGVGGGAGNGTSSGTENSSGGSSQGTGSKENSNKAVKDYERIFTPKNLGGEGEKTQVHGNIDSSGEGDVIQVKKFGDTPGSSIPYDEVLNIYKEDVYKRLDNTEIPLNMKELIRKYFGELED